MLIRAYLYIFPQSQISRAEVQVSGLSTPALGTPICQVPSSNYQIPRLASKLFSPTYHLGNAQN